MNRRLVVALVTAGFLGSVLAAAPPGQAESSTICIGRQNILQITPGFSLEPTRGTASTVVDGTLQCNGPIEGYQPTGTISARHEIVYGYVEPDTCSRITGKGWDDNFIPTADGVVVLRNHFTATFQPSSDPPGRSGTFEGDHLSGRFWFTPIEGDCVHSPLTRIALDWMGTWHGKRSR